MNEYYPTLFEMMPWHKKYPVSWMDGWEVFRGPKLGSEIPSVYVVSRSNEPKVSLSSLLVEKKLLVLIFDGTNHGDTTSQSTDFATEIEKKFPDRVVCFVVTKYYESTEYDPIHNILGDIDKTVATSFGARGQCVYVLDDTGTIVWKSCAFLKEKLYLYLKS